ncbi:hypothetical protein F5884DRAFT_754250 [Xylogone sp. PMI_703]|nr:hypothetical protein F5884DRAFT_754250 [Xylogone sp. PMI_703]
MSRDWQNGPFKLIETPNKVRHDKGEKETGSSHAATEMALVHNVLIRALNAIYLQAQNIDADNKQDVEDFTGFISSWSLTLRAHHDAEEEVAYPILNKDIGIENYMEPNIEQHRAFEPGLKAFDDYIQSVKEGKEKYNGARIRELVDDFAPVLVSHLTEEVDFISSLEKFEDKINWKKYEKDTADRAVKAANTEFEVPLMVTNMDFTFEKGVHEKHWPPWPWFAGFMFRWVFIPKHKGYWRFSTCDSKGMPKDLPFA